MVEHVIGLFDTIIRNAALIGLSESKQPEKTFRAPKDETLKPEAKKTRQRIDYGKIMALHNAGWSNQKIADEMEMTYNAVATAISTYKKKMKEGDKA